MTNTQPAAGSESTAVREPGLISRIWTAILKRYVTVLLLVGVVIVFSIIAPRTFMSVTNWQNILLLSAVPICMALAALLPLIVGEFDLSLGYMLGLVAMTGAVVAGAGLPGPLVILVMVLLGALVGLINALLTVKFGVSSFISTLGVGIILSAVTLGLSGGQVRFAGIPDLIVQLGRGSLAFGVANSLLIAIVLAIALGYMLHHTPAGRRFYATGGSERVATLSGINTGRVKALALVGAGALVGVASIFSLGQTGAANPSYGAELLLPAYAAAFLGVSTHKPGYYNVPGTLIAILLLGVGFSGLSILGVPFWVQPLFNGAVLLAAVLTARAEARKVRVG